MMSRLRRTVVRALFAAAILGAFVAPSRAVVVTPQLTLVDAAAGDQDDLCIWVHPTDPALSTLIVSDKVADRVFVYDLQGQLLQELNVLGAPGNIDVRYDFPLTGELVDVVAFNNRTSGRIMIYAVTPATRTLSRVDADDISSADNYGLCLYHSPTTGAFHVFTTTKTGVIRQFELMDTGGGISGTQVRTWNLGSITEGCVADDETGEVYFAEETVGIWKAGAEPGDAAPGTRIASVGDASGLAADVEGLTLYYTANGGGYLIASGQGNSRFQVYERAAPHASLGYFTVSGVSNTDGVDVTNVSLGPGFPHGLFACHSNNGTPKPVEVSAFEDLGLAVDTGYWNPRLGPPVAAPLPLRPERRSELRLRGRPNPFDRSLEISFELTRPRTVSLDILDGAGRRVARVLNRRRLVAGPHACRWNGRDVHGRPVAAGVYFYRLRADGALATGKVTVIR